MSMRRDFLGHSAPLSPQHTHVMTAAAAALAGITQAGTHRVVPIPLGPGLSINSNGELEAAGGGGGGTWGSITGTLSAQTDLQTALDGKAPVSHSHAWGSITGTLSSQTDLQTALNAKAASVHTHVEEEVAGSRYHEGPTAPGVISVGDEWFDTTTAILYKRVDNGGSPVWAEMNTDGPPNPSGSNTSVQYNDGGVMGGDGNLTWDKSARLLRAYGNITMNAAAPPALSSIIHGSAGSWQFLGNSLIGTSSDNLRFFSNVYANASHAYIAPGTSSGGILSFAGQAWEFYAFASGSAGRTVTPVLGLRVADDGVIVDSGRIRFPVTQIPSTNPNTLDDYEEGTWTPTVTAGSGSFTTVSATGTYVKVGRKVSFAMSIVITSAGTATNALLATLPFTNGGERCALTAAEFAATGWACSGVIGAGGTGVYITKYDGSTIIASGRTVDVAGTYFV